MELGHVFTGLSWCGLTRYDLIRASCLVSSTVEYEETVVVCPRKLLVKWPERRHSEGT